MSSYARYWLEAFRLPVMPAGRLAGGMRDSGHIRTAFEYLAAGREVVFALPHGQLGPGGRMDHRQRAGSLTAVIERVKPESVYDRFVAFREGLGRGHEEGIGPVHLTAQNGDLMPERENLDLPGLVTAPEQDQELEETTEDEVEEGPQHKWRGCPPPQPAQALDPQVSGTDPVSAPHSLVRADQADLYMYVPRRRPLTIRAASSGSTSAMASWSANPKLRATDRVTSARTSLPRAAHSASSLSLASVSLRSPSSGVQSS